MRILRDVIGLALIAGLGAIALHHAHRTGQDRFLFQVERLGGSISLPVIYDHYSGSAEWIDSTRIRVDWTAASPEPDARGAGIRCVGKFRVETTTCYLLESAGRLYVEREEFIEPLILIQTHYARYGELPDEVTRILNDPDLDRNRLTEVLSELNR